MHFRFYLRFDIYALFIRQPAHSTIVLSFIQNQLFPIISVCTYILGENDKLVVSYKVENDKSQHL